MEKNERNTNLYLSGIALIGLGILAWAIYGFSVGKVDAGLVALSVVTVFLSSYLRFQLPHTKLHFTISDVLVFLSLMIYGGEVAVLLAALEACYGSLNFRRQRIAIKPKTILLNVAVSAMSAFVTAGVVSYVFTSGEVVISEGSNVLLAELLLAMAAWAPPAEANKAAKAISLSFMGLS